MIGKKIIGKKFIAFVAICSISTVSLADRYYPPSETSLITAENQYTGKPYTMKLAPTKRIGDMFVNKVIAQGVQPLIYGHQKPRDPIYLFAERDPLLTLEHFKAKAEAGKVNYYSMHMELSSKDAVNCVSDQTKEILKSKYFKAVHKDHTTAVVLWDKSSLELRDQNKYVAERKDIFHEPQLYVDVGESDQKSEFSVILRNGYCDYVHHWKIDRILKERYPKIAEKVDKEIQEKLAKSICGGKLRILSPNIDIETTTKIMNSL